jgi:hypothetical protein
MHRDGSPHRYPAGWYENRRRWMKWRRRYILTNWI